MNTCRPTRQRWKQAPGASEVELREVDPTRSVELLEDEGRDQEPAEHEEHVDADESPWHRQPGVEGDDHQDRDGPQALNVRASI